eukprot:IDg4011t1
MAHSKAAMYTGQHGMVVGQDADNKVSIVAWGLYPTENTHYYEEMFKNTKGLPDIGLVDIVEEEEGAGKVFFQGQQWTDMDTGLWYGDGFRGFPLALTNSFSDATQLLCTKHLTNFMRANKSIKNTYQDAMVWAI